MRNPNELPAVGQTITENMGIYEVLKIAGRKLLVRSGASGVQTWINWDDSGYRDPRNAWRALSPKSSKARHHATKKSPTELQRDIDEVLTKKKPWWSGQFETDPGPDVARIFRESEKDTDRRIKEVSSSRQAALAWLERVGSWPSSDSNIRKITAAAEKRLSRSHSTVQQGVKCPSAEHPLYPELRRIRQLAHDTSWGASQLAQDAERAFRNGDCDKAATLLESAKRVIAKERRKSRKRR